MIQPTFYFLRMGEIYNRRSHGHLKKMFKPIALLLPVVHAFTVVPFRTPPPVMECRCECDWEEG